MNRKLNVLIIGAGNIGAFFDKPGSKYILTHAHAFNKHTGFRLAGFTDTNQSRARKAASLWRTKSFLNVEDAFRKESIDIVTVAVPDNQHFAVLQEVAVYKPRFIFTEKPLVTTRRQALIVKKIYSESNIPVSVNYCRRFVPQFQELKKNIDRGLYGRFISGSGYYCKGLLHNGSHLIDMLIWLLGDFSLIKSIHCFGDYRTDDKNISALAYYGKETKFMINAVNSPFFSLFEADFVFERKRIRIKDSGFNIEFYNVEDSKKFSGYREFAFKKVLPTDLGSSLYYSAENIYKYFTKKEKLHSSLMDAFKTTMVCLDLRKLS